MGTPVGRGLDLGHRLEAEVTRPVCEGEMGTKIQRICVAVSCPLKCGQVLPGRDCALHSALLLHYIQPRRFGTYLRTAWSSQVTCRCGRPWWPVVGADGVERHPVAKKTRTVGAEGAADKSSLPALGGKTSPMLSLLHFTQIHLSGKTCQNVAEEQPWVTFLLDRSLLIAT